MSRSPNPWLRASVVLLIGVVAGCGSSTSGSAARVGCPDCTVLVGAKVFDGMSGGPGTVVLRGERIDSLHRGEIEVVGGEVVDLSGRTILPGLVDLHVHIRPSAGPPSVADRQEAVEAHFKALLRSGVTTVLDLGTEQHVVFAYRQRIRDRALLAPSLLAAGPGLTRTGGHPCYEGRPPFDLCAFVDSPQDGTRVVDDLAADEPDMVKVVIESGTEAHPLPELDVASLEAIKLAARAEGMHVVAHVAESADMVKALDAGMQYFAHLPVHDRIDAALVDRLWRAAAVVIPTAAVVDARYRVATGALDEVQGDAAYADLPESVVEAWRDPSRYEDMRTDEARQEAARRRDNLLANIRICHEAGVRVVAGTDAGNPATFHGLSMPRELALYVEAGLTPVEALRSATVWAARVMSLHDRGSIHTGARADLLVVHGDPTEDIASLANVDRVYLLGELLDREALAVSRETPLARTTLAPVSEGGTCLREGECAAGLVCTSRAWCRRPCESNEACADREACFDLDGQTQGAYCHPGEGCDPLEQDCPNAVSCVWLGQGVTRCWYPGKGEAGEPCSSWGMCAPGHQCDSDEGMCIRLCRPGAAETGCKPEQTCVDRSLEAGRTVGECR